MRIARHRDQFITLAKNVRAVKLVHLNTYKFPTDSDLKQENEKSALRNIFKPLH